MMLSIMTTVSTTKTDKEVQRFPVIAFDYPYSETGEMKLRYVRVTAANATHIYGYELVTPISKEDGNPKTYSRVRMSRYDGILISF